MQIQIENFYVIPKDIPINHGYIYKITNKFNNKCYIGQTVSLSTRLKKYRSYRSSMDAQPKLYNALRKYRLDAFIFEIIDIAENQTQLNEYEIKYVSVYNSMQDGYNNKEGGNAGGKSSPETCSKISKATAGVNNPMYGRKRTHSAETLKRISDAHKGKFVSEETKLKMRESALVREQKRRENGWAMPMEARIKMSRSTTGKRHTEESKLKMSLSKTGTKRQFISDNKFIMVKV